jgi:glucose-1-phosphate thymidylyltransferase
LVRGDVQGPHHYEVIAKSSKGGSRLKAVVLAAGEGKRLRPFTISRPKGMIPVGNRPVLDYIVEALVQNGVKDIIMVVGYHRDTILSHFEDGRRSRRRL